MRLVVTGLSGNLGTALLRRLTADGDAGSRGDDDLDLVGVARRRPPDRPPYDRARWVQCDLAATGAQDVLRSAMIGADAVVHLAWGFQPSHDTDYLERTAVAGTRAVLSAADRAGVPHLVHLSSLGVYAPRPPPTGPGALPPRVAEDWPRTGIDSLAYSRHKVAAEQLLDHYEARGGGVRVARLRPGLILQEAAGSAILRYTTPGWLPSGVLHVLPVLPLDRRLVVQGVHADDVASAIVAVLDAGATGAFNLAAEPPLGRDEIAHALGARGIHLPGRVLRAAVAASWQAHLQPLDPGWLDLAFAVPLMDTTRARTELGWRPTVDARAALDELLHGMATSPGLPASPVLRPRSVLRNARRLLTAGPASNRRLP